MTPNQSSQGQRMTHESFRYEEHRSMSKVSEDDIRKYIQEGEGPHVEFKTRFTGDNLIARHVSAFANSGGGVIIFGVGPDGEVLGLSKEELERTMERLTRLTQSLLPMYAYTIG